MFGVFNDFNIFKFQVGIYSYYIHANQIFSKKVNTKMVYLSNVMKYQ